MSERGNQLAKAGSRAEIKATSGERSTPFDLSVILGRDSSTIRMGEVMSCLDGLEIAGTRSLGTTSVCDDSCTHLSRSLLVKLKLRIHGDEQVSVLCATEDICSSGMLVHLPCQLGLSPGSMLDMDLFVGPDKEFVSLQGRARRIARIGNEDMVGYVLEVDFHKVNGLVEKQIAAFIHSSQIETHRLFMAQ